MLTRIKVTHFTYLTNLVTPFLSFICPHAIDSLTCSPSPWKASGRLMEGQPVRSSTVLAFHHMAASYLSHPDILRTAMIDALQAPPEYPLQ
jgi:hypothetical protein